MKNIIIHSVLLLLSIGVHSSALSQNNLTYSLEYNRNDLKITSIIEDEVTYSNIVLGNMHQRGEIGAPLLPEDNLILSVPFNSNDFKITTEIEDQDNVQLLFPPLPQQDLEVNPCLSEDYKFLHLDLKKEYLHPPLVDITSISTIGGFCKIVTLNINPIQWDSGNNDIVFIKRIKLTLSWSISDENMDKLCCPLHQQSIDNATFNTKMIVANPDMVEKNNSSLLSAKNGERLKAATQYEYIPYQIITTKKLAGKMERLAAFRRLRGVNTKVMCIEDILNDPYYSVGDFMSGIKDDAGKLRGYLFYAHQRNGTDHVLLAGSYPEIPGRWVYYKLDSGERNYISDQYYRDLMYSWPMKTENEYVDLSDLRYTSNDLNIGRISFANEEEVDNYVDKLIQYEFNVKKQDLTYLDNAYIQFGNDGRIYRAYNRSSHQSYLDHYPNLNLDSIALSQPYTGSEAIKNINLKPAGLIDWRCHGGTGGVVIYSAPNLPKYGISPLDDIDKSFIEAKNGLDNLTNRNFPSWSLSISCSLAELGIDNTSYTFADSYILGKDYGGVTFIGNRAPSSIAEAPILCRKIFLAGKNLYESGLNLPYSGLILNQGCILYNYKYERTNTCLTGDPLTPIWYRKPLTSNKNGTFLPEGLNREDKINVGINSFIRNNPTFTNTTIEEESFHESINSTRLLSRTDMCPFIYPTRISGLEVNEDNYLFTGLVRISSIEGTDKEALLIKENRILEIEALEEADISGKISLEEGSCLKLKSYQPIKLSNVNFSGNGEITLSPSNQIVIGKNTEFRKNVGVTIKRPRKL